jgi:hypothetical protein
MKIKIARTITYTVELEGDDRKQLERDALWLILDEKEYDDIAVTDISEHYRIIQEPQVGPRVGKWAMIIDPQSWASWVFITDADLLLELDSFRGTITMDLISDKLDEYIQVHETQIMPDVAPQYTILVV